MAACLMMACSEPPKSQPKSAPKPVEKPQVARRGVVATIDLTNLFTLQQSGRVLLYDARPGFVYAFGHLPGAINWPRGMFASELKQHESEIKAAIAEDKDVVLYCTDAACPDAGAVARRLAELGYSVSVLDGGFAAWKEAGQPIE